MINTIDAVYMCIYMFIYIYVNVDLDLECASGEAGFID